MKGSCVISSTIWYELQMRDWPITNQPVETIIWLVGRNEGIKNVLSESNLGKEVTVSLKIMSTKKLTLLITVNNLQYTFFVPNAVDVTAVLIIIIIIILSIAFQHQHSTA